MNLSTPAFVGALRRRVVQITLTATNAAGTGAQTLTLTILRPKPSVVALSATNAAGTGTAPLTLTVYR